MYTLWYINVSLRLYNDSYMHVCNAHKTLGLEELSMTLLIVHVGRTFGCLVVITHTYTQIVHAQLEDFLHEGILNPDTILLWSCQFRISSAYTDFIAVIVMNLVFLSNTSCRLWYRLPFFMYSYTIHGGLEQNPISGTRFGWRNLLA